MKEFGQIGTVSSTNSTQILRPRIVSHDVRTKLGSGIKSRGLKNPPECSLARDKTLLVRGEIYLRRGFESLTIF